MTAADWTSVGVYAAILLVIVAFMGALLLAAPAILEDPAMIQIYRDAAGEYRWRLIARNGRTIADSGEGYSRLRDCHRAVRSLRAAVAKARVTET